MPLDLTIEAEAWGALDLAALAHRAITATLLRLDLDPELWEVSLLAADDARIAALNGNFRDKPQPTNVLSWPSAERRRPGAPPLPPEPDPWGEASLGDLALAFQTCQREARDAQKPLADHASHLIVHGTLHLLGFDHETEAEAQVMERLESEIMIGLGLDDPYMINAVSERQKDRQ